MFVTVFYVNLNSLLGELSSELDVDVGSKEDRVLRNLEFSVSVLLTASTA